MKQTLAELKGETDINTVILEDFNVITTEIERMTRQKTKKETEDLNNTINQVHRTVRD